MPCTEVPGSRRTKATIRHALPKQAVFNKMDCTGKMMKWIPMLLAPVDVIHASLSRYLFLAHNRVLFHVLRRIIALHHECTCLSTAPTAPLPQCCTQGAPATALHPRRICHSAAPKARLPQYCTAGAPASALHRRCTCLRIARAVYLLERGSQGLECCSSNSPVLVRGREARKAAHSSFIQLVDALDLRLNSWRSADTASKPARCRAESRRGPPISAVPPGFINQRPPLVPAERAECDSSCFDCLLWFRFVYSD